MTSQFVSTASNMVASVRSIIEGYRMGPTRALAQEPVQNSKDAAPRGRAHVEYRLHRRHTSAGADFHMLTVTDSNTSGLQGPIRSLSDIAQGEALSEGENWAAFEGMGYTKKSSEDALGSRGQGKAAYLCHSRLPALSSGQERMIMLYDTLLADGEYRLGVRYANPSDVVRHPPFRGDEARNIVSTRYSEHGLAIELGLESLTEVGARVIVPYLSQEAVEAIRSGELESWLQHCWWRAVQMGLAIDIVDEDGEQRTVGVPRCWIDEPWRRNSQGLQSWENLDVGDRLQIKRIVLLYDDALNENVAEFQGVQLLRGQQWIESLGQETLGDYIPRERRPGFRGFVEFDRRAERQLHRAENPQHEHFDRRTTGVRELLAAIESKVREFAEEQGWGAQALIRPAPESERDAATEFLRFLSPHGRAGRSSGSGATGSAQLSIDLVDRWECISVENHTTGQRRINNGDTIGVQISVTNHTPDDQTPALTASLGDLLLTDMMPVDAPGFLPGQLLLVWRPPKPAS